MEQKVIKDFLNVPGINGLALVDGRSRPFFCGVEHGLNFQQKQALSQGLQQVIETTPATYQFFQFQFGEQQAYVHKLPRGLILLVFASDKLVQKTYLQSLSLLEGELQRDGANAIANFQTVAGQTAIGSLGSSVRSLKSPTVTSRTNPTPTSPPSTAKPSPTTTANSNGQRNNGGTLTPSASQNGAATKPVSAKPQASAKQPTSSPGQPRQTGNNTAIQTPVAPQEIPLDDFVAAINALLHLSFDYLGKTMVANYWKSSRPPLDWLSNFEINSSGKFVVSDAAQLDRTKPLSSEQQQWLREWVKAFVQRCGRIIRDFPKLLIHSELDINQKKILFSKT